MIFHETKLKGAFVVEPERIEDERGFFSRNWSQREFAAQGLNDTFVESNTSLSQKKGTLRGMHFQAAPHAQVKLVRCTQGAVYDVVIDLRADSPTFKQWVAVELTAANGRLLYVPQGFAHGFQTLVADTEVFYLVSAYYAPESAGGVRWNDPVFAIQWPEDSRTIIERDRDYPDFDPAAR
ncbi:MAG: dTDP-4-dehydrorhamnose 3,5-epimerase [Pyrinomonadaceae bacterium]